MCSDLCCANGPGWSHETAFVFLYMGDREGTDFTLLAANLIGKGNSNCSWCGGEGMAVWLSEVQTACHSDEGLIRVLSLGDNDEGRKGNSGIGMVLDKKGTNREGQKSLWLKSHALSKGTQITRPYRSHSQCI